MYRRVTGKGGERDDRAATPTTYRSRTGEVKNIHVYYICTQDESLKPHHFVNIFVINTRGRCTAYNAIGHYTMEHGHTKTKTKRCKEFQIYLVNIKF